GKQAEGGQQADEEQRLAQDMAVETVRHAERGHEQGDRADEGPRAVVRNVVHVGVVGLCHGVPRCSLKACGHGAERTAAEACWLPAATRAVAASLLKKV